MIEIKDKELTRLRLSKKVIGNLTPKVQPVKKEIDANTKATLELAGAIKSLAEKEVPKTEAADMTPLFGAIEKIQKSQEQIAKLLEINSKPKYHEFLIERDSDNRTKKILVKESRKQGR